MAGAAAIGLACLPALVFFPATHDVFILPKLLLVRLLTLTGLIALAVNGRAKLRPSPLHAPVLALLAATVLATVFSAAPLLSLLGAYQNYAGLLSVVDFTVVYLFAACVLTADLRRTTVSALVGTGALISLYGILQHFGLDFGAWDLSAAAGTAALRYRSFATLGSPAFLGIWLAMVIPLAVARDTARFRLAAAVMAVCLVFTYSRGAWIACGLAVGWLAWRRPDVRLGVVVFVAAALAGFFLAPLGGHPSPAQRLARTTHIASGSIRVRMQLWNGAIQMARARPVTGWGPDTFKFVFPRFAPSGMAAEERSNVSAHNDLLDRASETGLIGLLAYLWFLFALARLARRRDDGDIIPLACGCLGFVVATQFGFSSVAPTTAFWLLAGGLAQTASEHEEGTRPRALVWMAPGYLLFVVLAATMFVADVHFRQQTLHGGRSACAWAPWQDFYRSRLAQALEAASSVHEAGESYQAAVRANPLNGANHALLARWLQERGRLDEAVLEWQTTIALDPHWARAHNALGTAYRALGRHAEAIVAYRRAIELDHEYAAACHNLGNVYLAQRRTDLAIECYSRALAIEPHWQLPAKALETARALAKQEQAMRGTHDAPPQNASEDPPSQRATKHGGSVLPWTR